MDIEGFYDEDERRRASEEIELGTDWFDENGVRYELSWIVDTGELYVMREPSSSVTEEPFGPWPWLPHLRTKELTVAVVGWIPTRDQLNEVLKGWEDKVKAGGSIDWVAKQLEDHKVPATAPT